MGDNNPNENNNGQQNADQQNQQPQYDQNQNPQNNPYQQPQYNQPQYQQPQYGGQSQQPQNQQYQQGNQQNQQNPYQQNQYQQYPQYQQPQKKDNGMAIGALVCGIVGILLGCCAWYITLPVSIVGLVLGILCLKKQKDGRTMAIVGIVLCSFGILISVLAAISMIALLSGGEGYLNDFYGDFNLEDYY